MIDKLVAALQTAVQEQRREYLRMMARSLARDPYVSAYAAEADGTVYASSILHLLEERREEFAFGFAIVLDPQGRALARTDRPGAPAENLAAAPLVATAMQRGEAFGIWLEEDALYDAVAVPIARETTLFGYFVVGFPIDDSQALEMKRLSGTDVVYVATAATGVGPPRLSQAHTLTAPYMSLIADTRLGPYEIVSAISAGGMGEVYRARDTRLGRDVAVKLFKGALTSDGSPHGEMAACIRAGEHPNLINVYGKIADHPAEEDALVMGLVDGSFRNLAGPPSLDSCTRDIYAAGTAFSPMAVINIAFDIASAVRHLHAQGILHGDLYAHNILHSGRGDALLGDFGAASFFAPEERQCAEALQRIEVRAFACLLEELLERCAATDDSCAMLEQIADLQERCAQEDGNARPLFAEIERELQALRQHVA